MAILLTNAILCDIDPPKVENGSLRIEGGLISECGPKLTPRAGDEVVDCGGAVVLPGMVNGHTHLYSALAVGMPPPPKTPQNFYEILKYVWWRLDQALDAESIEMSARIGAIEAIHCGTTTLIDHHASPNYIEGSLDLIENALGNVGPRGVLCYETTDRHGRAGREAGLAENRRYLKKSSNKRASCAGLVGAHASFTLEEETWRELRSLANDFQVGLHIHVAEDPCDETETRRLCGRGLLERYSEPGMLSAECIIAHGTHLGPELLGKINNVGAFFAHNSRSNMNNAVGYAPVASFKNVVLGTDGIGADMFAEAKAAWFISRHQNANLSAADIVAMLAMSARRTSRSLGLTLGRLEQDAAADIVVTSYRPFTELTAENLPGHLIFAMSSRQVDSVMVNGNWKLRARRIQGLDEGEIRAKSSEVSKRLWQRMAEIPI